MIFIKKFCEKYPLAFALICIGAYVIGFSLADGISESIGRPKLLTIVLGAVYSAILLGFVRKNKLQTRLGLCRIRGSLRDYLWFLPLIVVSTASAWGGFDPGKSALAGAVSMVFVGLLEEVIFRGLLFTAMRTSGLKTAVIVSSLTFGMGHIVNLLSGAPLMQTLLQLVYAAAVGFCFTMIFCACGSIWPCIVSHVMVNALSCFAAPWSMAKEIVVAVSVTAVSLAYGVRLWKKHIPA